jgi:hypothetical protein
VEAFFRCFWIQSIAMRIQQSSAWKNVHYIFNLRVSVNIECTVLQADLCGVRSAWKTVYSIFTDRSIESQIFEVLFGAWRKLSMHYGYRFKSRTHCRLSGRSNGDNYSIAAPQKPHKLTSEASHLYIPAILISL